MTTIKAIKMVGALLLLLSITLPMSKCSYHVDSSGNRYPRGDKIPGNAIEKWEKNYAFDEFEPLDPGSWTIVLVFTWPVLALGSLQWRPHGRVSWITRGLEPLLLAGSVYIVNFISTFFVERRDIGAYVAFIGLGIYAIGVIWSDISIYRNWKNGRRT
ncbi:MAG: hypothetical protein GY792_28460 [Gammaproteobacteria bacterium]|nr:hypothetical protein [Gammaproteobacteria bacterium]